MPRGCGGLVQDLVPLPSLCRNSSGGAGTCPTRLTWRRISDTLGCSDSVKSSGVLTVEGSRGSPAISKNKVAHTSVTC